MSNEELTKTLDTVIETAIERINLNLKTGRDIDGTSELMDALGKLISLRKSIKCEIKADKIKLNAEKEDEK